MIRLGLVSVVALGLPAALAAQDTHTCSEPGMVAAVVHQEEGPIEGLALWRGSRPALAQPPAWQRVECVPGGSLELRGEESIPEGSAVQSGAPDLDAVQALLLEAGQAPGTSSSDDALPTREGPTLDRDPARVSRGTTRVVFFDPRVPDHPVHVVLREVTSTRVALTVDAVSGPIDVVWSREHATAEWSPGSVTDP